MLRWFRAAACVPCLARDAGISQATGDRDLPEGIDVLAAQARHRHEVLQRCRTDGMSHGILTGTLSACDRVAGVPEKGHDWYSGRHKRHGGNIQFLATPDGTPLGVLRRRTRLGARPDRRPHPALPALYAARQGLPPRADVGYTGAGSGYTPFRPHPDLRSPLAADTRTHNRLLRSIRSLSERAASELTQRWRALQHVTLSPNRIGAIAQATLALNNTWR